MLNVIEASPHYKNKVMFRQATSCRKSALVPPFDGDQNVRAGQHDDIWNGLLFTKVTVFILGILRGWARRFHYDFSAQDDAVALRLLLIEISSNAKAADNTTSPYKTRKISVKVG